jgi:hypothetical protein
MLAWFHSVSDNWWQNAPQAGHPRGRGTSSSWIRCRTPVYRRIHYLTPSPNVAEVHGPAARPNLKSWYDSDTNRSRLKSCQVENKINSNRRELSWGEAIWGQTDQQTNGPTNGPTDEVFHRGAYSRLKICQVEKKLSS